MRGKVLWSTQLVPVIVALPILCGYLYYRSNYCCPEDSIVFDQINFMQQTTRLERNWLNANLKSIKGYLHFGGLRTALVNFLYARHTAGMLILRVEDTDQARIIPHSIPDITSNLEWAGITFDEGPHVGGAYGPYYQSERTEIYRRFANQLVESGAAYPCYCSSSRLDIVRKDALRRKLAPRYDNKCRSLSPAERASRQGDHVIRFKLQPTPCSWQDAVYGDSSHDIANIEGDPVILKSDGYPTYHLANVVDDYLMEISHVFRGAEWITSTPKHIQLAHALNISPPKYGHLPLMVNADNKKLSKRQSAMSVSNLRQRGYLPVTLTAFLMDSVGGLGPATDRFCPLPEAVRHFSLSRVRTHPAKLDMHLLDLLNREVLTQLTASPHDLTQLVAAARALSPVGDVSEEFVLHVLQRLQGRLTFLQDIYSPEYEFLWSPPDIADIKLQFETASTLSLNDIADFLCDVAAEFGRGNSEELACIERCREKAGFGKAVAMKFLRIALTGKSRGLPIGELVALLGIDRSIKRIESVFSHLNFD